MILCVVSTTELWGDARDLRPLNAEILRLPKKHTRLVGFFAEAEQSYALHAGYQLLWISKSTLQK